MPKFTQYRAFVSVVENGSVSAAAKELMASPSAISKQLSKLEADVGTQLIDRSTHVLNVTHLGHEFYQHCKYTLFNISEAESMLHNKREKPCSKLAISFAPVLLNTPFLRLLEEFSCLYPDIKFDLQMTGDYVDLIKDNIDFAFRVGELEDSRLTAILMHQMKLCFCAAPRYLEKHGALNFENLIADHHLIIPTFANASAITNLLKLGEQSPHKNISNLHTTESEYVLDEMTCASLGVSLTLDISVNNAIKQGRLLQLFMNKELPTFDLNLLYHKRDYMPKNMRLFKDFFKKRFPIALEKI